MDFATKLFSSIILGFFIFSFTNLFFGEKGIVQRSKLENNIEILEKNLNELEGYKQELIFALKEKTNSSYLEIEARKNGMYGPNDVLVQVEGLKNVKETIQTGKILPKYNQDNFFNRNFIIILSCMLSCLIFLLQLFFSTKKEEIYGKNKSYKHSQS